MDKQKRPWKLLMAGLLAGVLVLGTLAATQPAIAAAPLKWAKIWKKEIKPRADKRYYTKVKSEKRYTPKPTVIRGALSLGSAPSGGYALTPISWGISLDPAPTAHIIANGGAVPLGCSGTPAAPSASPGHLCIFEQAASGYTGRLICSAVNACGGTVSPFGAYYGATTTGNSSFMYGSWAVGVDEFTAGRLAARSGGVSSRGAPGGN
jgi:hypothetical protein